MEWNSIVQVVGPNRVLQLFGVKLIGVNAESAKKLIFSVAFVSVIYLLGKILHWLAQGSSSRAEPKRVRFWTRQGISIILTVLTLVGLISLWFDNPATLTTAAGMVTAGLAFALQRVVTAFAGYLLILRGKTFSVGDRITMGGIRGDVVELNFLQTVIMEMGQPGGGDSGDATWIQARQYTGRLVRVSNANVFEDPVYNYTRDFPYIWEELRIPIPYDADRSRAEQILLQAAQKRTLKIAEMSQDALMALQERYLMKPSELEPQVFWRLTDNWLEMTVRFIVPEFGIRHIKSQMSRDILDGLDNAGIGIASGTYEIVKMPPLRIDMTGR